jgi:hypothetical protein
MPYRFVPRRLTPAQDRTIARRLATGAPASALAEVYGVTVRTIFRARRRAGEATETVRVGDWQAVFAMTEFGPVQIDQWRPAS